MTQKKPPMTGSTSANFHEGSRSEYLAHYVFASMGTVVPVPRQEDTGVDLYCTLTERVGKRLWPRHYFTVQVKSDARPWIFDGADSVRWLVEHPLPIFLCVVRKQQARITIYATSPRFLLWALPPLPTHVELRPGRGTHGRCSEWKKGPVLSLGAPIAEFLISDILKQDAFERVRRTLEFWIKVDAANLRRIDGGIRRFVVPAEFETNQPGAKKGWATLAGAPERQASGEDLAAFREALEYFTEAAFKAGRSDVAYPLLVAQRLLYPAHRSARILARLRQLNQALQLKANALPDAGIKLLRDKLSSLMNGT